MQYKLNASLLNRTRSPRKLADGHRLFWQRNNNGTLTAWQRVVGPAGKTRDIKLCVFTRDITADDLAEMRRRGMGLKSAAPPKVEAATFTLAKAWETFYAAIRATRDSRWSESTAKAAAARIETYVRPTNLWAMPVGEIQPADIYEALLPVRLDKPATEEKVRQVLAKVFTDLMARRMVPSNPVRDVPLLAANLTKAAKTRHFPALTDWAELGELLQANATSDATFLIRVAAELQAYTAQRTAEIVAARWGELDLKLGKWTIPRSRMKTKDRGHDHVLLLPPQVVKLLESLPNREGFLFPSSAAGGHISANALPKHLKVTLGYRDRHVPHAWRSSLRTLAGDAVHRDRPLFQSAWIESVLDHKLGDTRTESAYIRGQHVEGAGRVLAWWADRLDRARAVAGKAHRG